MARLRRALVLALALVACRAAAAPPAVDVDPARHAAPGGPGAQLVTGDDTDASRAGARALQQIGPGRVGPRTNITDETFPDPYWYSIPEYAPTGSDPSSVPVCERIRAVECALPPSEVTRTGSYVPGNGSAATAGLRWTGRCVNASATNWYYDPDPQAPAVPDTNPSNRGNRDTYFGDWTWYPFFRAIPEDMMCIGTCASGWGGQFSDNARGTVAGAPYLLERIYVNRQVPNPGGGKSYPFITVSVPVSNPGYISWERNIIRFTCTARDRADTDAEWRVVITNYSNSVVTTPPYSFPDATYPQQEGGPFPAASYIISKELMPGRGGQPLCARCSQSLPAAVPGVQWPTSCLNRTTCTAPCTSTNTSVYEDSQVTAKCYSGVWRTPYLSDQICRPPRLKAGEVCWTPCDMARGYYGTYPRGGYGEQRLIATCTGADRLAPSARAAEPAAASRAVCTGNPPAEIGVRAWNCPSKLPGAACEMSCDAEFMPGTRKSVCDDGEWQKSTGDKCSKWVSSITPPSNPGPAAAFLAPTTGPCRSFTINPNQGERVLCVQGGSTTSLGNQFRIATLAATPTSSAVYRTLATDTSILYTFVPLGLFFRTAAGDDTLHAVALVPVQVYGQRTSATRFCAFDPSPLAVSVPVADVLQALNRSMACSKVLAVPVPVTALPPGATASWTNDAATCAALQPDTARTSANVPAANITSGAGCAVPDGFSACQLSEFSDWGPCTRLDITKWDQVNKWEQTRTRTVVRPGDNCPALTETRPCDAPRDPAPSSVSEMAKQALVAFIEAMPSAIFKTLQSRLPPEDPSRRRAALAALPAEKQADFAAGRRLWLKQADPWQKLWMRAFNGPASVLRRLKRNSPEVRAARAKAKAYAQVAVAEAYRDFNQMAISQAAVDASIAAQQALAAGDSGVVASASAQPQLDVPDVSALVKWNGGTSIWASFSVGGMLDNELAAAATQYFIGDVYNTASWLRIEDIPGSGVLSFRVAYDSTAKTATFEASSGKYMYLLALVRQQLVDTFGVTLPDMSNPSDAFNADVPTITTSVVVATEPAGLLKQMSLGLGGSWTAQKLATKFGFDYDMPNDLVTISNPSLVYVHRPMSLSFAMTVDIPLLGVSKTTTTLRVTAGKSVELLIHGTMRPVPQVAISDVSFKLLKLPTRQFQASAKGQVLGIEMAVLANVYKNKTVTMSLTAQRVSVGGLIRELIGTSDVPAVLFEILDPIRFGNVSLSYNSAAAKKFSIRATPDVSGAPALKRILDFIGLSVNDVTLEIQGRNARFGLDKSWTFALPSPFAGPGTVQLSLGLDSATRALRLAGRFVAALRIPGVEGDVGIDLSAGVFASPDGVGVSFSGATLDSIVFTRASFIRLGPMTISASASVAPAFMLTQCTLSGSVTVFGVTGQALFMYDKATRAVAFQSSITNLDLEMLLSGVGVNVDLGIFNIKLTTVRTTISTVAIPALGIKQGLQFFADLSFIGMRAQIAFELAPDGISLAVQFNTTELSRVIALALEKIDRGIRAIGQALTGAGGTLRAERDQAARDLAAARRQVNAARADAVNKLKAFDRAKEKAKADLDKARRDVDAAQTAFDTAVRNANNAFAKARADVQSAEAAFARARVKARTDLDNAKADLARASADFDAFQRDANKDINEAQAEVDSLWADYNRENDEVRGGGLPGRLGAREGDARSHADPSLSPSHRPKRQCDGWPDTWDNCIAAGGIWLAIKVATAALDLAHLVVTNVFDAVQFVAFKAAQETLTAAQKVADGILQGVEAVAVETANAVLSAAQEAATGVLRGTQYVALETARGVLSAAETITVDVLSGVQFAAAQTANGLLNIAEGSLVAAEAVSNSTLTAFAEALDVVGNALQKVSLANFLRINGFGIDFTLRTTRIGFGGNYDVVILGTRYSGSFRFEINFTNPLDALAELLMGLAMDNMDLGSSAGADLVRKVMLRGNTPTTPAVAGDRYTIAGLTKALAAEAAVADVADVADAADAAEAAVAAAAAPSPAMKRDAVAMIEHAASGDAAAAAAAAALLLRLGAAAEHQSVPPPSKKKARHAGAAGAAPRSHVWCDPHRQRQDVASDSTGRSSASGAPQQHSGARQRNKCWAALTTWLRMNLHTPRTAKKLLLFVGAPDAATGRWRFELNPQLTWDDVSVDTKGRLATLPLEAEQAFQLKHPGRPAGHWGSRVQRYRPPGRGSVSVSMRDLVESLHAIFLQHEPQAALGAPREHAWHASAHLGGVLAEGGVRAWQARLPSQQPRAALVEQGLLLDAAAAAALPLPHDAATAASTGAAVRAGAGLAESAGLAHPPPGLAVRQRAQPADGGDSGTESSATPAVVHAQLVPS
ncbi:hypothetical protein HT031_000101 [Scenedesmus sp. PABB004]|nr:hypothetical protein HT031_000101 [Scenedesmus sp. PABB004]